MSAAGIRFRELPETYAVCRLDPGTAAPDWARGAFVSITSTADEVSVVCLASLVPAGVKHESGWRALQLIGPFPLATVGVLASFATPLAGAGISLLAIGTYDTDYLLVKASSLDAARTQLIQAGHVFVNGNPGKS